MTTWQIIVIMLTIFLSGGLWYGIQKLSEKRNQQLRNQEKLLMGLGYTQIMFFIRSYLSDGKLTQSEYEELQESLCEPYLALSGNKCIKAYMVKLKTMIVENRGDEGI